MVVIELMPQHLNISNIRAIEMLNFALVLGERIKKIEVVGCLKSGQSLLSREHGAATGC